MLEKDSTNHLPLGLHLRSEKLVLEIFSTT
jgi:hypothetical protein